MTQLLLDLERPLVPTFDNFVVGRNREALSALRALVATPEAAASGRSVYLWGDPGSGRSHLLQAAANASGGTYLVARDASAGALREAVDASAARGGRRVFAIDDVAAADGDTQEALFHAINALRDDPLAALIVSGDAPPRDLALAPSRDDLRSRLAWGLAYRLQRLDDDEKDAALFTRANDRGFPLAPDVRRYLLTHFARDLGALMRMVDALDRHARETQRVVTVPLIRAFLQRNIDFESIDTVDRAA